MELMAPLISLLRLFGLGGGDDGDRADRAGAETRSVRKIVAELEAMDPQQARYLACFAYVLSRVANADRVITADETAAMERLVIESGAVDEDQAVLVVAIARSQNQLLGGTEDYLVTREFGKQATPEQRRRLVHALFVVAAADGSIAVSEENEIARIAAELGVSPGELRAIRGPFGDQLETVQALRKR